MYMYICIRTLYNNKCILYVSCEQYDTMFIYVYIYIYTCVSICIYIYTYICYIIYMFYVDFSITATY